MYECKNCGAQVRYDIETGVLVCDHCSNTYDPDTYQAQIRVAHRAQGDGEKDTRVFESRICSCPQCGGEIVTANEEITGYCNYCGSQVSFDLRTADEEAPDTIIPFTKTKKDCIDAFRDIAHRMPFSPKEMDDEAIGERLSGIYMPYWVYHLDLKHRMELRGTETHADRDRYVSDDYLMSAEVNASGQVQADASSFFSDSLSEKITPFEMKTQRDFSPGYLCGFSADRPDVSEETYLQRAKNLFGERLYRRFISAMEFQFLSPSLPQNKQDMEAFFPTDGIRTKRAFFPVWFLSWRHDKRVSYAVMNGQTGSMHAEIPVSRRRILLTALLFSVPVFLLLLFACRGLRVQGIFIFAQIISLLVTTVYLVAGLYLYRRPKSVEKTHTEPFRAPRISTATRFRGAPPGTTLMSILLPVAFLCAVVWMLAQGIYGGGPGYYPGFGYVSAHGAGVHWAQIAGSCVSSSGFLGLLYIPVLIVLSVIVRDRRFFLYSAPSVAMHWFVGSEILFLRNGYFFSNLTCGAAACAMFLGATLMMTGLIQGFNVRISHPTPVLFQRKQGAAAAALALLLLIPMLPLQAQAQELPAYTNPDTGYQAVLIDRPQTVATWREPSSYFSDEKAEALMEDMISFTQYGNLAVITEYSMINVRGHAMNVYAERFGDADGAMIAFDRGKGEIYLFCAGEIRRIIPEREAAAIVDDMLYYYMVRDPHVFLEEALKETIAQMELAIREYPASLFARCAALFAFAYVLTLSALFAWRLVQGVRLQPAHKRHDHGAEISFTMKDVKTKLL